MSDDLVKSHIEWLRGDHELCNPFLADRIEALEAERDALREAFTHINAMDPEHRIDSFSDNALRGIVLEMGRQARAALNRETDT